MIAAAAAEAVTLAKAAVKFAKDAAMLVNNNHSAKADITSSVYFEADVLHFNWVQPVKTDRAVILGDPRGPEAELLENHSMQHDTKESDDLEATDEKPDLAQEQLFKSTAVRSRRQTERKAKRAKAAVKAAANVVSVKPGSTSRKKRASIQEVDYSDPLHYLRATTSTSRLLTATEELELSEGIQVCFTHERFTFTLLPSTFNLSLFS